MMRMTAFLQRKASSSPVLPMWLSSSSRTGPLRYTGEANPTAITLGKAFVIGHYQRSAGWATKCEPAQTFEPLDYKLTRRLDLLDRVCEATGKHLPRLVGKQSKRYWAGVKGRPVRPFWWSSRL